MPYVFALLGIPDPTSALPQMDSQIRHRRTLEAIKRILVRETLDQPLTLICEDLHWFDGESQAFLDLLVESVATARLLLLVDYRPEYHHGWGSKTYYTQLRLDPLGKAEAGELLAALLGVGATGRSPLQALAKRIIDKTEGNPFFIEEVVQTLAKEGVLRGDRGSYRLEKVPAELHIPVRAGLSRPGRAGEPRECRAGLSRLWREQGKHDDARTLLAEIYGWFTDTSAGGLRSAEGFETRDLKEAKALLEEVSR